MSLVFLVDAGLGEVPADASGDMASAIRIVQVLILCIVSNSSVFLSNDEFCSRVVLPDEMSETGGLMKKKI